MPCPINEGAHARLKEAGIDDRLANHVSHLFIRDPLVVFDAKLDQDDANDNDHFENIQSTNWNTVRFKPPPVNQDEINWRVEFRPMELNLTDFENAAFSVYLLLLTRAISTEGLNFYMPMSKVSPLAVVSGPQKILDPGLWTLNRVDENMKRAHRAQKA